MQSYQQLQIELGLKDDLPVTADWSAAADFLSQIKNHCLENKPNVIVECSSGLTSVILARCCQLNETGKVYSLENGKEYVDKSQLNLNKTGLDAFADIIYAPLQPVMINDNSYDWYSLSDLPDLKIDMLVIDGPPGFIQKHSRFPALPLLMDKLSNNACVFLDDAARDEEKELVAMWLEMYPYLDHEYIETDRGCSVLQINKS